MAWDGFWKRNRPGGNVLVVAGSYAATTDYAWTAALIPSGRTRPIAGERLQEDPQRKSRNESGLFAAIRQ
jgi:hypothetical protein